ncbi:transmembrane protein 45B [Elysia marginata]|uniref:Transmembrane protein 45B n=1 Tax=Elysia marginata TaxID=1093978 RepID=A0AAV4FNC6_9GAST|nr:transmembrane protein 45B [Elysia marginata]
MSTYHGWNVIKLPVLKHPGNFSTPTMSNCMLHEGMSGHIVASLNWFLVGFLYIVSAMRRYYTTKLAGQKFVSSVEFPFDFLPGRLHNLPFVALYKIFGILVFISVETIGTLLLKSGCVATSFWQHGTMAMIFLLSGVVDIILLKSKDIKYFPDGTDYLLFGVNFGVQALQFVYHLEGRTPLSARLHGFQAFLAAMCALALAVEAQFRHNAMMPIMRGYFIMMQGTWMMHLMFILYHPGTEKRTWDEDAFESVELASMMFMYHMTFDLLLILVVNLVFAKVYSGTQYKALPHTEKYGQCIIIYDGF